MEGDDSYYYKWEFYSDPGLTEEFIYDPGDMLTDNVTVYVKLTRINRYTATVKFVCADGTEISDHIIKSVTDLTFLYNIEGILERWYGIIYPHEYNIFYYTDEEMENQIYLWQDLNEPLTENVTIYVKIALKPTVTVKFYVYTNSGDPAEDVEIPDLILYLQDTLSDVYHNTLMDMYYDNYSIFIYSDENMASESEYEKLGFLLTEDTTIYVKLISRD